MLHENQKLLNERIEEWALDMLWVVLEDQGAIRIDKIAKKFGEVPLELRGDVYLQFKEELGKRDIPFDNTMANLEAN